MVTAWQPDWDVVRPIDAEPDDDEIGFEVVSEPGDEHPLASTEAAKRRIRAVVERHSR